MGLEWELKALLLELLEIPGKGQEPRNEGAVSEQITAWYSCGAYNLSVNRNLNFTINTSPHLIGRSTKAEDGKQPGRERDK